MFCHGVLLDEAMASWEDFSCVFCFMSLLIVSKLSGVCLFWSVVPFFASRLVVSCIPTCEGDPLKGNCLALSVEKFYFSSCFFYCLGWGLFEATVWMADLGSARRTAFLKDIGLSSCCSAMAIDGCSESDAPHFFSQKLFNQNVWNSCTEQLDVSFRHVIFPQNLHLRLWPYASVKQGHACLPCSSLFPVHVDMSSLH